MRAHTLYYFHKLPVVIKLSRQSQTIILSLTVCMSTRYARKPDGLTIFLFFANITFFHISHQNLPGFWCFSPKDRLALNVLMPDFE